MARRWRERRASLAKPPRVTRAACTVDARPAEERGFLVHVSFLGGGPMSESDTYPDVSQMYLTCSVTFQENTCILTFCMYFTRIPNESKIHLGYTSMLTHQIHQDTCTCILLASLVSHWYHTGYISGYIRIRVSWTLHHDTSGYMYTEKKNRDTCILDGIHDGYNLKCSIPRMIERMYLQRGMYLKCKIHTRYIRDTCICRGDQDTYGIHLIYI